ncbi:ATPase [Rathayibacter sp. AY1C7]|uniref:AAA family ATPase n=1 Tax=Rathayibacter sp. AY1C7 TaxID=2080540 RepID=UPI000CE79E7D|nr:AAA family ATPase [Rathayibacter sp. AY1C7]PPG61973.1 ATPase [Rathayibacter sp. AY1C7]
MPNESDIEPDARDVLRALAFRKNVILSGAPGTGKSRLLGQVRDLFQWQQEKVGASLTGHIPIPPAPSALPDWFPSPSETLSRRVYPTVFDQNTKYRDVMRGLVPSVGNAGVFTVTSGTLFRAAKDAKLPGHAALVIIDEINRGPAVAAFGSALVGLEADKRSGSTGEMLPSTQEFEILGDTGASELFSLPSDLYILASMNEADTSVEPLDVAFLRRFQLVRLEPDSAILRQHFRLPADSKGAPLPESPQSTRDWYEVLVRAFDRVSEQVVLGRGQAYQLGHGALMHTAAPQIETSSAAEYVSMAWGTLHGHLEEVFFGNSRAMSDILGGERSGSPYQLTEAIFGGQTVRRLVGPIRPTNQQLYKLLRLIAGS